MYELVMDPPSPATTPLTSRAATAPSPAAAAH